MEQSTHDLYRAVFKEYPDVMDAKQISKLLGVSTRTVYKLIHDGSFTSLKVGRSFRVPKIEIMRYTKILDSPLCESAVS